MFQKTIIFHILAICIIISAKRFSPLTRTDLNPLIESVLTLNNSELSKVSNVLARQFNLIEFEALNHTTVKSMQTRLISAVNQIDNSIALIKFKDFSRFFYNIEKALKNSGFCAICQLLVALFQLDEIFVPVILDIICELYMLLSTSSTSNFCAGLINLNLPTLSYIRRNSAILNPEYACSVILQTKECYFTTPPLDWDLHIPTESKIMHNVSKSGSCTPIKVLHLSDLHISLNYKEGSVVDCGYPLCCLDGLGDINRDAKAGYWGDYKCDLAPSLFNETINYIQQNHRDLSMIFVTGDVVDHTVWNTSIESNAEVLKFAYQKLLEAFPGINIYPVIGNHDYHPVNLAPPIENIYLNFNFQPKWLYNLLAELWEPWLTASDLKTFKKYGYYATNYSKELKIIGINSNLCFSLNWWLLYDTTFLEDHFNWLNYELRRSELAGQKVFIIGHNSMGDGECIEPWEKNLNRIIERYSHIITMQLIGHTHGDELKIFYDREKRPINVAWNGGSLTTYEDLNPNYKIIYICPDTWEVLDIDTYVLNLTEANLYPNNKLNWYKSYSMKSEYNLTDLSPKSYDNLIDRMNQNANLRHLYWLNYVRYGDEAIKKGCDNNCQQDKVCSITRTYKQVKSYC